MMPVWGKGKRCRKKKKRKMIFNKQLLKYELQPVAIKQTHQPSTSRSVCFVLLSALCHFFKHTKATVELVLEKFI